MRNWKALLGIAMMSVLVGFGLFQIYCAVIYGEIRVRAPFIWISKEVNPAAFALALLITALAVLILGGLLAWVLWSWRSEHLWLKEKRRKPPMDEAIRRPGDGET
ncbi:MAG: hypothetical protein M3248_04180 [Actinomycetota bacterium]|nr:hypothetical protein [Actinomycetota bacterium]